jgi:uncharacterized protein YrrD
MLAPVDYGDPISYLALTKGVDVLSADGDRIGAVEHVIAAEDKDIFDGIVIDTRTGPGGLRFVDAPDIGEIHERAVLLKLSTAAASNLHEPAANPAVVENHGVEDSEGRLEHKLKRAWEVISGKG